MQAIQAIISGENAAGVVTLDGRILGDTPAMAVLSENGDCYIGLHPDMPRFYGVTRRLRFTAGRLAGCPPDVRVCDWGGGLMEIFLRCGELPEMRERRFPFTVARCVFEGALAVMYVEDGLWLSLERNGRVETGFFMHADAEAGQLLVRGRTLFAAAQGTTGAALAVDAGFMQIGRVEADRMELDGDGLAGVTSLDSRRGYEKRTRWDVSEGRLLPVGTETGFFTREPADCPAGLWFLEAMLAGREDEAEALLSPQLGRTLSEARDFIGAYSLVRPHPVNPRAAGVAEPAEGAISMRTLIFETEGNQIVNISEES